MTFLPYSRPLVLEEDIAAVAEVLRQPMISQGQRQKDFETAFAAKVGATYAVAFSSGTAALHGLCAAAQLQPGDEVILPPLTFAATANAVLYCGATPVFADIDPQTWCLDPEAVEAALSARTRALLTVDFAGHPSDYDALQALANAHDLLLLSDAAHAPGAMHRGRPVGRLANMTAFSFNPVKNLTSAEGGMVTTDDPACYQRLSMFRTHGMTRDPDLLERPAPGGWYYEQHFLGFNYKLSELHAALGLNQLKHLDTFNQQRRILAAFYDEALAHLPLALPNPREEVTPTWHLYVVQVQDQAACNRAELFAGMRQRGFGVQVHYVPVPLHPYYERLGYTLAAYPHTAAYYDRALSIPLHPAMSLVDAERVVEALAALTQP